MTLIELLIVIVILATLTAAALPILTPTTTERRIREASRALNSYISQAIAKSIATRRPYGIVLERLSSNTGNIDDQGVCLTVYMAEQPAPYSGFDENSRVRLTPNWLDHSPVLPTPGEERKTVLLQFVTRGTANPPDQDFLPEGWDFDLVPSGVLRPCDVIDIAGTKFELKHYRRSTSNLPNVEQHPLDNGYYADYEGFDASGGERWAIIALPLNDTGQVIRPTADNRGRTHDPNTGLALPEWLDQWQRPLARRRGQIPVAEPFGPYWGDPVEYHLERQPVITEAPPLQMPDSTAIDLQGSGTMGDVPLHAPGVNDNDAPIFIMFSPDGSVERVQCATSCQGGGGRRGDGAISKPTCGCGVTQPTSGVSLLVGRRELIPAARIDFTAATYTDLSEPERAAERSKLNWLNLESRWVNVGAQTGTVTTTPNAFVEPATLADVDFDGGGVGPLDKRRTQIQAAQEFAREMKRMGGR